MGSRTRPSIPGGASTAGLRYLRCAGLSSWRKRTGGLKGSWRTRHSIFERSRTCWQKTATARGEAADGGGGYGNPSSVGASRLRAHRDYTTRVSVGVGGGPQPGVAGAAAGAGGRAAPVGLPAVVSGPVSRRLRSQSQARGAVVPGRRTIAAPEAATQAAEPWTSSTGAARGAQRRVGGRFHTRQSVRRTALSRPHGDR